MALRDKVFEPMKVMGLKLSIGKLGALGTNELIEMLDSIRKSDLQLGLEQEDKTNYWVPLRLLPLK